MLFPEKKKQEPLIFLGRTMCHRRCDVGCHRDSPLFLTRWSSVLVRARSRVRVCAYAGVRVRTLAALVSRLVGIYEACD